MRVNQLKRGRHNNMKRYIILLLFCMTVNFTFSITFTIGNLIYTTTSVPGEVSVSVNGKPTVADISIPGLVGFNNMNYNVTSISNNAFSDCSGLITITIPTSVTSIGSYAFSNCSGLKSLVIPTSVTSIGSYAFSNCTGLTTFTIPYQVTSIGSYAFTKCSGLTSITILSNISSISSFMFYYCTGLKSVEFPASVTSIGSYAFSYCTSLKTFPIPATIKSIGQCAFANCTGLTTIAIPSLVTSVSVGTFSYCTGLTSITIPTSVTSIESSAFSECSSLLSIVIPSSVTSIGESVFYNCSGLSSIYVNLQKPIDLTNSLNVFWGVNKRSCTLIVPTGSKNAYQLAIQWKDFISINESYMSPEISTNSIVNIAANSATSGGNVISSGLSSVTARGVCWSTSVNPIVSNSKTSDGNGTGSFESSITGLSLGTTYHIRAYATNSAGTAYGSDLTFTTTETPALTTISATSISTTSATSGGNITSDGGATVTARGICWSTSANPMVSDSKTSDGNGTGAFVSSITGLSLGTTYHIRAYATNSAGTSYGDDKVFTTNKGSELDLTYTYLTNPGFDINCNYRYNTTSTNLATSNGTANDLAVTGWSTIGSGWTSSSSFECGYPGTLNGSPIPTLASDGKNSGSGVGVLGICGGWLGQVIYYQNVSLPIGVYKIIYKAYNSSTPTYALSKVGWQTASDSTLSKITIFPQGVWTNDTVTFTLNSVTSGRIQVGMQSQNSGSSGNARIFFDYIKLVKLGDQTLPVVTTTNVSTIAAKTAVSGGAILSDGGASVTVRGLCWSTTANPMISNSKTSEGTGVGIYSSNIIGLLPNTTYHMRAYATNSIGTSYGSDLTFTTLNNTALNDNSIELFNVYPNPTNGTFILKMESNSENDRTLSLLNMLGQKVYESKLVSEKSTINLSAHNLKGIYFLQLHNEKGILLGERKIIFK